MVVVVVVAVVVAVAVVVEYLLSSCSARSRCVCDSSTCRSMGRCIGASVPVPLEVGEREGGREREGGLERERVGG